MSSLREGYFTSLLLKHTSVYIPDYVSPDQKLSIRDGMYSHSIVSLKMAGAAGLKVLRESRYKRIQDYSEGRGSYLPSWIMQEGELAAGQLAGHHREADHRDTRLTARLVGRTPE